MKKCTECGIEKPLSEFFKNKSRKDGHSSGCKACRKKYKTRYRQENKEKIAEYNARYRQENKEKIAEYNARYRQENKEKLTKYKTRYRQETKEKMARYYQENKDKIVERSARYYQENKEKMARYYQENKEKLTKYKTRYRQETKEKEPACVYQIKNKQNGKIYIGETLRGKLRWRDHLGCLRGGYHKNSKLQKDFDKFGEEAFKWEILKEFPKDKETLLLEEARTINKFLKEDRELYNLLLTIEQLKLLQENGE